MFNQLFKRPAVISRHINAPLLEDRRRYLVYRTERGTPQSYLCEIARFQITAIKYLGLEHDNRIITNKELQDAAKRWAHHELQCFCGKDDRAQSFYAKFGFEPSLMDPFHPYLLLKDVKKTLGL